MCRPSFNDEGLSVFSIAADAVHIDPRELAARLGADAEGAVAVLLEQQMGELRKAAVCRAVCRVVPVATEGPHCTLGGLLAPVSQTLARSLSGCRRAYLFAATLGLGVDRLIARQGALSAAGQFMLDAAASALIEGVCDHVQAGLPAVTAARCSPGYGDFDLEHQERLLHALHAERTIGLTLTEKKLMVPTKSVSAVIGIKT